MRGGGGDRRRGDGRASARNAMLINALVCPGLGSLLAGRIACGLGQLLMAGVGFTLVMAWFVGVMIRYYALMFDDGASRSSLPVWVGVVGAIIFIAAWFWGLGTGIAVIRSASHERLRESAPNALP